MHVGHKVGSGHLTARDECSDPGDETKRDQEAGDQFDPRAQHHDCTLRMAVPARRKTQELLSAMTGKQQSHDQAHDAVNRIGVAIKEVHKPKLITPLSSVKNFGRLKSLPPFNRVALEIAEDCWSKLRIPFGNWY